MEILAAADVLVAVIDESAGEYSVPSKILSYLCAGRPIVLSAPRQNLAAKIIKEAKAGVVVDPNDQVGFVTAVQDFINRPSFALQTGLNGRAYAEKHFNIEHISNQFEQVFFSIFHDNNFARPPVSTSKVM